jgi:hypothetical protein
MDPSTGALVKESVPSVYIEFTGVPAALKAIVDRVAVLSERYLLRLPSYVDVRIGKTVLDMEQCRCLLESDRSCRDLTTRMGIAISKAEQVHGVDGEFIIARVHRASIVRVFSESYLSILSTMHQRTLRKVMLQHAFGAAGSSCSIILAFLLPRICLMERCERALRELVVQVRRCKDAYYAYLDRGPEDYVGFDEIDVPLAFQLIGSVDSWGAAYVRHRWRSNPAIVAV